MTEQASRFLGSVPENYDRYLGPRIFDGYAADLATRVARLSPSSLLELAAGTGIVTRKLRDLIPDECIIVATDLNEPMLEVARSRFLSQEPVKIEQADAMELPFSDERFDAVVCQFGVMFFPDKHRSYAEVLRVMKPGGTYIFNVWDSWEENPFAGIAHRVVTEFFPDDPPGFYKVPFHYHDADEIGRAASAAGFSEIDIEHLSLKSEIPSATDFAKGLVFGNPLNEEIVARGGDPQVICAAVASAIRDQLGSEMPLRALIVEAKKAHIDESAKND